MSKEEKNRLIEILFYNYFNKLDNKMITKKEFWDYIKAFCSLYEINFSAISVSLRQLMMPMNKPNQLETVYLMKKAGFSVRNINAITDIYWQQQVACEAELKDKSLIVRPKIFDAIMQGNMRRFVNSMNNIYGVLNFVDDKQLKKL